MHSQEPVAVLLNANAKRVNGRMLRMVRGLVPERDVFVSRSAEEAQDAAREVIQRGYSTVCTGGGDGTLVNFVNTAHGEVRQRGLCTTPDIGVLKLGTGNAIASYVGAGEVEDDLRRISAGLTPDRTSLPLLNVDGSLCHFAGLGLDAAIINDYNEIKDTWYGRHLKYLASVPTRTFARQLTTRRHKPRVHVRNAGGTAWRCGPDGRPIGDPIEPGGLIYEGPITLLGASTTPFYGYGMRIYPFAGQFPGRVQLRVAHSGVAEIIANVHRLWNGTHRSKTIHDFWVEAVSVEFERAAPLQVGGDGRGYRERVTISLSQRSVQLVDLRNRTVH